MRRVTLGLLAIASFAVGYVGANRGVWLRPTEGDSGVGQIREVAFVTNGLVTPDAADMRLFVGRFTALQLGVGHVYMPAGRPSGSCDIAAEGARIGDPKHRHQLAVADLEPVGGERWFDQLSQRLADSKHRDVLVFVHGYNVSFREAICRAAQLAEDMPFDGELICYCWPSAGKLSGYGDDAKLAELSPWALGSFLCRLRRKLEPETEIHVMAHSMGNRALLGALQVLRGQTPPSPSANISVVDPTGLSDDFGAWNDQPTTTPPLTHIIFGAPDVERETFTQALQVARPLMTDATLYASSRDIALWASSIANLGDDRAGDAGNLVLMEELVTIDASPSPHNDPLGHSYYGNSQAALQDLKQLITLDVHPDERSGLVRRSRAGRPYWRLIGKRSSSIADGSDSTTR